MIQTGCCVVISGPLGVAVARPTPPAWGRRRVGGARQRRAPRSSLPFPRACAIPSQRDLTRRPGRPAGTPETRPGSLLHPGEPGREAALAAYRARRPRADTRVAGGNLTL